MVEAPTPDFTKKMLAKGNGSLVLFLKSETNISTACPNEQSGSSSWGFALIFCFKKMKRICFIIFLLVPNILLSGTLFRIYSYVSWFSFSFEMRKKGSAKKFFRIEGLRVRGVVRWPTVGKVQRMTPAHRARPLLTPPTAGRMASATSCYPELCSGYTVMFPGLFLLQYPKSLKVKQACYGL